MVTRDMFTVAQNRVVDEIAQRCQWPIKRRVLRRPPVIKREDFFKIAETQLTQPWIVLNDRDTVEDESRRERIRVDDQDEGSEPYKLRPFSLCPGLGPFLRHLRVSCKN